MRISTEYWERKRERKRERERERQSTERAKEGEKEGETDRRRETDRERQAEGETETQREWDCILVPSYLFMYAMLGLTIGTLYKHRSTEVSICSRHKNVNFQIKPSSVWATVYLWPLASRQTPAIAPTVCTDQQFNHGQVTDVDAMPSPDHISALRCKATLEFKAVADSCQSRDDVHRRGCGFHFGWLCGIHLLLEDVQMVCVQLAFFFFFF